MTSRQRTERAREVRLWINQVIIPTATVVATAMSIPEVRQLAISKYKETKQTLENKLRRSKGL